MSEERYERREEERSERRERKNRVNPRLVIGVIVLIVLLMIWLTVADFTGDTDVAADITPSAATALVRTLFVP